MAGTSGANWSWNGSASGHQAPSARQEGFDVLNLNETPFDLNEEAGFIPPNGDVDLNIPYEEVAAAHIGNVAVDVATGTELNPSICPSTVPAVAKVLETHVGAISSDTNTENDPIDTLRNLIANFTDNASELLPRLRDIKFSGASCKIIDTEGPEGSVRKFILQIDTITSSNYKREQSPGITDISEESVFEIERPANFPKSKKQKNSPRDVSTVRRSKRLAGLKVAFIDEHSANEAALAEQNAMEATYASKGKGIIQEEHCN